MSNKVYIVFFDYGVWQAFDANGILIPGEFSTESSITQSLQMKGYEVERGFHTHFIRRENGEFIQMRESLDHSGDT